MNDNPAMPPGDALTEYVIAMSALAKAKALEVDAEKALIFARNAAGDAAYNLRNAILKLGAKMGVSL